MKLRTDRNLIFISFSQFATTFSFNFIYVFLPFYIFRISSYTHEETLLWIGAIMGSAGLCTVITSPLWGSLTRRFRPKLLYLRGLIVHLVTFFIMGFAGNLSILLILRIIQGLLGGISTIGLIIVSSSYPKERITSNIGFYQSSITLGQLLGPLIGSLAAATMGYKGAFVSASGVVFASFIFCRLYVKDIPRLSDETKASGKTAVDRRVAMGWLLCFTAQTQLMFLPSILPNVFERFNIEQAQALKLAGMVVMLYVGSAMIGTYVWSSLSRRIGFYRMITFVSVGGILLQASYIFSKSVIDFTILRVIQTGLVAATMPLVMSLFASELRGSTIGVLNSARFAGNALGPFIATSVLAFSGFATLHLFISGLSLVSFLGFGLVFKGR